MKGEVITIRQSKLQVFYNDLVSLSNLYSLKSKLISFDVRVDAGVAGATHAMVDLGPLLISLSFG